MRENTTRQWWKKKVIGRITLNQVILLVLVAIICYHYYEINWDWVFGLR